MDDFDILLEETSPNGNVIGVVEQGAGVCYFYLKGDGEFGVRSCWVRNLDPAPDVLDAARMRRGLPPLLVQGCCRHPAGAAPLHRGDLTLVWAEEGDSAALYDPEGLLAVIPFWSGHKGFSGYARDCLARNSLCWPLGTAATNAQFARYEHAREFWRSWDTAGGPWRGMQEASCRSIATALGPHSNYYGIDGGKWPPRALVRTPCRGDIFLTTVGLALRPQPGAEFHQDDSAVPRRIELGIRLQGILDDRSIMKVGAYVSGQCELPWLNHTFLGPGHTLPSDVFAELSGGRLDHALFVAHPIGFPPVDLPDFRGDPVTVLWLVPISAEERALAQVSGSRVLLERMMQTAGGEWFSFSRKPCI